MRDEWSSHEIVMYVPKALDLCKFFFCVGNIDLPHIVEININLLCPCFSHTEEELAEIKAQEEQIEMERLAKQGIVI